MVSSGGSGTSSAPNIPAPSGQLNPTPGGAAPSYPSFLANLGPGQMASGLTPQMIQQIQGSGYAPTPPPPAQPPMQAPDIQQARNQLATMMRRQALAAAQTPERGFNAPRGGGGDYGGGRSSSSFGGRAAGGRGAY
jgi:hypothetical protein